MPFEPIPRDLAHVGIIASGALGDVAQATAGMAPIRAHHTGARITLFTDPAFVRFFRACPFVDAIEPHWRPAGLVEDVKARWGQWRLGIKAIYDLTNSRDTEAMFRRFRPFAPLWSGTATGCSHPHADRQRLRMHYLDRIGEQLSLAGIGPEAGYPEGSAPLPELDWVTGGEDATAARQGIQGPFALIAPEGPAEAPAKTWPAARYGELAGQLAARGIRPVIVGGPGAMAMAAGIRAAAPEALDLVARLDLFQFASLAREAALAFGGEGDLTIVAAAAGAPTVALVNPAGTVIRQVAPRGRATVTLVSRRFADIAVEQVLAAARAVNAPALAAPAAA